MVHVSEALEIFNFKLYGKIATFRNVEECASRWFDSLCLNLIATISRNVKFIIFRVN